jgi:hypothetical protein
MTTPKIPTVHQNDSRLYVWENEKYPGVTSVVGMLPKPALQYWAAKKVAEAAIERGSVTQRDFDWLKAAPRRDLSNAADIGTEVHDALDDIVSKGESVHTEEVGMFIDGYQQWVERYDPKWVMNEETVLGFHGDFGYAGSFDLIAEIDSENWLIDFKTTRSGVHPEVALQLSAYANAKEIIHPDGSSEPVPRIDRCGVLWLRPDVWKFVELRVTQDPADPCFETFGALLKSWHWDNGQSKKALGSIQASGVSCGELF